MRAGELKVKAALGGIRERAALATAGALYAVMWLGGVAHHWLYGGVGDAQNRLASLFLLLAGAIVLLGAESGRALSRLACVALLGFVVEVCGVHSGFPFRRYVYTQMLWPRLFGVPLVMAFAWMTLVAYVGQSLPRLQLPAWAWAAVAALWMTAIDLLIDPLAANSLGYWRWAGSGLYQKIPATNFAGWFLTSLLTFSLSRGEWRRNAPARFVGAASSSSSPSSRSRTRYTCRRSSAWPCWP